MGFPGGDMQRGKAIFAAVLTALCCQLLVRTGHLAWKSSMLRTSEYAVLDLSDDDNIDSSAQAVPDMSDSNAFPDMPETQDTSETPNTPDTPDADDLPDTHDTQNTSVTPDTPDTQNMPGTQIMPEQMDAPYDGTLSPLFSPLPGEAVVSSFDELKTALEDDNGITVVYFGADITMRLGGIRINPAKQNITISGINPYNSAQTVPYTLTDYSSASFYDTIYIDKAGIDTIIVCDMNITGKNFYGPVSVFDSAALAGVSLVYERVNYNGPQLGYHRTGTIYLNDCTAFIHGGNGGSLNQEFSEAKHLVFSGTCSIDTNSSANTVFWHPLGGTFELYDNASLSVISPNTSALYGIFYADGSAGKVNITIGRHATFNLTISGVVAPEAFVTLSGLTVSEFGEFNLKTTKSAAANVLRISGALTVMDGARFSITGFGGTSSSLLRQESGDITVMRDAVFHLMGQSAYSSLLNLYGRSFICNDPASVLLYNEGRTILATNSTAGIYINAQQINYWSETHPGGLDAPAGICWHKPEGSNFVIDAALSPGTGGDFSSITSNYEQGNPPGYAPSLANLSMKNARVLAFGRLYISIQELMEQSLSVSGNTRPDAAVRAVLSRQEGDIFLPDSAADLNGLFHIPAKAMLSHGTVVTVKCSWQYLTVQDTAVVSGGGGELELIVPELLEFRKTAISAHTLKIGRQQPGWGVSVSDNRAQGGAWRVYARLSGEMTPLNGDKPPLYGAMVFLEDNTQTVMSTDSDTLIVSNTSGYTGEVFSVTWPEDMGFQLIVQPGTAFADTTYSAGVLWTVTDGP